MKKLIFLCAVVIVGIAIFISCGGGGGGSAEQTGTVKIVGDSN